LFYANSGLDAVNVSVRVAATSEPGKLVYGGLATPDVSADLGRFSLSHATTYSITLEAADLAGNLASSHAFIRVDDTAPTTRRVLDDSNEIHCTWYRCSQDIVCF
jgi:hypothetical protein